MRQQRVLTALRTKIGVGELPAMTEALDGHLFTNLSVLDLGPLSGKIDVDRRIELSEGEVLQATTNTNGQYILIAVGQTSSSDYQPIHRHIKEQLSAPVPGLSPSTSDGPT